MTSPTKSTSVSTSKGSSNGERENGYVVTTDGVTIRYGSKQGEVARYRRGQVVKLNGDATDIANLVKLKAIAPNDGKAVRRTTALVLAKAQGAEDDPVKAPVSAVLPSTATDDELKEASGDKGDDDK